VLAAQTNDATTNRAISVAQTCDLPDLASVSVSVGTVFFVQSLCVPVVAGIGSWLGMDNQVLRQDSTGGVAWSWGGNCQGRLGDGSCTNRSSPVSVVGGFTDWSQLSAGRYHSLGLRTNGTAWGWGCNGQGRLGDNNATVTQRSSPVLVVGGITDWCQISAGGCFSLAVRQNGTAWAWGAGGQGRLGDNTIVAKSSPVSVVGGFTDWCQVAASGNDHSLGVRQNGTAWAWGGAYDGRSGANTTVSKSSPVSVVGGFTDWCQVNASRLNSHGIRQNGTLWAWGNNFCGTLGDNTTTARSSPVSVVGGFTDWCQISFGYRTAIAVRQNGTAWAWGQNQNGSVGDCTTISRSSPVSVVGGQTWCQVSSNGGNSNTFSFGIKTTVAGL
jgi:alpha-tubulin suppressor-like RCC1 family protein